ncbi:hypothetical protein [Geodermatophilus sabuli]|uniref:hypothetical protein n=1 Tax=Geodermatophilus sabuli TaxID=1564158 RepID=UPI000BE41DB2|nr:hypothetical protein [Geodermatophilus sabuli]MBB3084813.1 hypothetical protein [Geodermatophilus sabuli]
MDDVARRTTLRLVAGLAVGVALLGGCAEKQEASDTLPSAGAAEPSEAELPPLGPAEFPVPDGAREKTPEGALSFARYYMSLGKEIGAGSVPAQSLRDLSVSCPLCQQIAASYEADQQSGYTYRGFTYTFKEYGPPLVTGNEAELGFVYSQSEYVVVDASGREVLERSGDASGDLQSGMLLQWRADLNSWLVSSLTVG